MNPYIKYCERCGEAFDIATNFNICPMCRIKEIEKWEERLNKEVSKYGRDK